MRPQPLRLRQPEKTMCDLPSESRRETCEVRLQVEEAVGPVKSTAPDPFRHAKPRPSSKMLHEGAHDPHHLLNRSLKGRKRCRQEPLV